MNDRSRTSVLAGIMAVVALGSVVLAIFGLYRTAFKEEKQILLDTVRSQARLIEAVASFDALHSQAAHPDGAKGATLEQVVQAHKRFVGFGQTGEFELARKEGGYIIYVEGHRTDGFDSPEPVPFGSEREQAMQRALQGESGAMIGLDYRGERVLAAYEPVALLNLGIVAKIDVAEIREPFMQAGLIVGIITICLVVLGSLLFIRITRPILERSEARTRDLAESGRRLTRETEDKEQAERELKQSEEQNRAVLETVIDGILVIDHEGIVQSVNPAAQRIFGYEEVEVVGNNVKMLMPEPFRSNHDKYLERYLRTGERKVIGIGREVRGRRKDGSTFPLDLAVSEMRVGDQRMFTGIIRDIADRKKMEDQLKKLGKAVEHAGHAIYITDATGNIQYVNPAFEKYTGYAPDETLGRKPSILKSGEQDIEYYKRLWQTVLRGNLWEEEVINRKKTGEKYHALQTIAPFMDEKNKIGGFVAIQMDVTEQMQARLAMQKAKETAEAANRTKSEFLANMSHEIRTPMNAVIGFSELLTTMITDPKQKSYLDSIRTAGRSLLTLINDILDLSKIEAGKFEIQYEPVRLRGLFEEMRQIFEMKMRERNLEYVLEIDQAIPEAVMIDETRIRQILLNLIGNAVKFTEKGQIKLTAEKIAPKEGEDGLSLLLAVEDTGIGIQEDQKSAIFESFHQQKGQSAKQYGGTGLGLAITRRLVEMMNGNITVKSEKGVGSRFELVIPDLKTASVMAPVEEDSAKEPEQYRFKPEKVLVVDDIESNRDLLRESLSKYGLDVTEAKDGKEAIRLAEETSPALILMDIRMPVMDGFEAIQVLKQGNRTRDMPVIALSASATTEEKQRIQEAGFEEYISKPVDMRELARSMSRYLALQEVTGDTSPPSPDTKDAGKMVPEEDSVRASYAKDLEIDIIPLWQQLQGTIEMDEVVRLSDQLMKLSEAYNLEGLSSYAQRMKHFADTFDFQNVKKMLDEFGEILHQVKKE